MEQLLRWVKHLSQAVCCSTAHGDDPGAVKGQLWLLLTILHHLYARLCTSDSCSFLAPTCLGAVLWSALAVVP